jgi:hypothetical protein
MKKIFSSAKTQIKKAWGYLSGKKRNIALLYWSILVPAITILWPEGAPPEVHKTSALIGLTLSYLGLGHAAIKKVGSGKGKPPVTKDVAE